LYVFFQILTYYFYQIFTFKIFNCLHICKHTYVSYTLKLDTQDLRSDTSPF